jgi:predicted nucleic acid-binding protein
VIVVDSSVWIDFLNGRNAPHVRRLRALLGTEEILVGDLMLCEVLQGLDSERAALEVEALLRRFEIVSMAGDAIATVAARNFRSLRRRGITVRKTIDLLIGTWCIENRRALLHNDSDFRPMALYLGLIEVPAQA